MSRSKAINYIDADILALIEGNVDRFLDAMSYAYGWTKEQYVFNTFHGSLSLSWSFAEVLCYEAVYLIQDDRLKISRDGQRVTGFRISKI